jgi:2-polyprenyl-6-methoxyphenol hydroxylase-like FAD-dependent oxidoreductase
MKAIVIGGGIGGLTSAIALRRAGLSVRVFERSADSRRSEVGGGIHLWHNGMRGLARLGLGEEIAGLGGRAACVERAEFVTAGGRPLVSWSVGDVERELGQPTVGVQRPQLHRVLTQAVDGDLVYGARCVGFSEDAGGVTAAFEDGREERGDVLVGADGIRSAVRRQVLGEVRPRFAGYASWQALAEVGTDVVPSGLFRVVWGTGARFLFYRVSDAVVYWEGIFSAAPGGRDPEKGRRDAVLARFGDFGDPVAPLVACTPEEAISRLDVHDRPPARAWGAGRVSLLGDAAHPMTNAIGQGANQAIEDALALARCLAPVHAPVEGLRTYERQRVGRANRMTRIAWGLTQLSRLRRPGLVALRDRGLALTFGQMIRAQRGDMALEL